jgi:hypothetical protein
MEHFNTNTMSYIPLQTVTGPDQHMAMPIPPQYDQRSNFDAETFIGYVECAPRPLDSC